MVSITLLLFLFTVVTVNGQDIDVKDECDYEHDIRTYFCTKVIDVFPKKYYGNYYLNCIDCNLRTFSNATFPYTNTLVSFNASDSGIMFITEGAFSKLSNVQYIYLQNNQILEIQPLAFGGLRQVYELHLEHNKIVNLTPGFLSDLEANLIDLSYNKIRELANDIFKGLLGVLTLDLSNNNIRKLGDDVFTGLDSLLTLNLESNKICHLPLGLFKDLSTLQQLNLADNKLTRFAVGSFSGLRNLNSLNIANNSISVFDGSPLIPFNHLTKLDISGNGIYYIDADAIKKSAPTLRIIKMDENLFSCTLLMNIVKYFKSAGVEVTNSIGRFNVQNVNGIACTDILITDKIDFKEFLEVAHQDAKIYTIYC